MSTGAAVSGNRFCFFLSNIKECGLETDDVELQPTSAILGVCSGLEMVMDRFHVEKDKLRAGTYEADVEALLIFNLGIRHVQGVVALARRDLVLLPAAYHLARAAFECGVRAAWLVDEELPMKREPRWLAHLDGEISAIQRSSDRLEKVGRQAGGARARLQSLKAFRESIAHALQERQVDLLKQMPNFEQMLSSIGGEHLYPAYIEASQYAHGGHAATWLYRGEGLGTQKVIRQRIIPQQWIMPLRLCWLALCHPGELLASRITQSESTWAREYSPSIDAAFERLVSGGAELLQ